jgi:hypothetical protein
MCGVKPNGLLFRELDEEVLVSEAKKTFITDMLPSVLGDRYF